MIRCQLGQLGQLRQLGQLGQLGQMRQIRMEQPLLAMHHAVPIAKRSTKQVHPSCVRPISFLATQAFEMSCALRISVPGPAPKRDTQGTQRGTHPHTHLLDT
jgi:hypothetical protein